MGNKKLLAGIVAALLVPTSIAAFTVSPASADGQGGTDAVFTPTNPGPFTISDVTAIDAPVSPQNAAGLVTDINVTLNDLGHTFPDDIDLELVAPSPYNIAVPLMSDQCGSDDVEDIDITFDQDTANPALPDVGPCGGGTFKPGNVGAGDSWPTAPTSTSLDAFDGINPNGQWRLRLVDDLAGDVGDLEGGFTLTIVTAPFSILIPGTGSSGPASPYPFQMTVSGKLGKVADLNVTLPGVTQQFMEDLDVLLVAPNGAKAMIMSDTCVGAFVTNLNYVLDDEAATSMPASASPCPAGTYKPTDAALAPGPVADPMPAPAPAGPYPSALSTFDGIDPNGTWSLYVIDDQGGGNGFFINDPALAFTMTDVTAPDTKITKKPKTGFKRTSKISFTSTEAGSTFQCKIDGKKWKSCSSPLKLKHLKIGKHKFQVRAIDAAGNVDGSPARAKWLVLKKR